MSNPNPRFIIVPGPFGAYSSKLSGLVQDTIEASLVTPGVTGFYQFRTNGPANPNTPDASYNSFPFPS